MTLRTRAPHRRQRWSALAVVVTILMGLTATTALAAPPGISLEQCRNGSATAPSNCTSPGATNATGWVNGNVGASQGHLLEGYSIPYRAIMTNLPIGTTVNVTLGYDIKHSGSHALDYLTQYDRLEPHSFFMHAAEMVDPTSGVNGLSATTDTEPILAPSNLPAAPLAGFNALAANKRVMTIFGGTIVDGSFMYVEEGDLAASQSEARVSFSFIADSTTAVLAWGGHIARGDQWNGLSASEISGSPYHMRVKAWTLNNVGNQDRSLSAGAVFIEESQITTQPNASLTFSATLSDSATVTGASPTGTVTFKLWSTKTGDPAVCSGELYSEVVNVAADGTAATDGDGSPSMGNIVSPTSSTTYYWTAEYSGDGNNSESVSPCGAESVTVNPPSFSTVPAQP
jgi:hypothetical protein